MAIRVNNLAFVLQDLCNLAQAHALFERALSIFRKFLGDDHPNTQITRENLELLINLAETALEATRTQGLSLDVPYKKPYSARHQFKKLYLHLNDSTKPVGID